MKTYSVIDSHTGGEPTRVVVDGVPDLGKGSLGDRLQTIHEKYDSLRSLIINEPRGSDVMVGAYLLPPSSPQATAAVIFFNNVGYLGMCVHGTIGVAVTLAELGRADVGTFILETPVGPVEVDLTDANTATVRNVPSYRSVKRHPVRVDGRTVHGDIAWGGNWFFLIEDHQLDLRYERVDQLTDFCWAVRQQLQEEGIRGDDGGEIDHIELFGIGTSGKSDSRNFVLCPGKAYDRSPCGTGTSAKIACLAAEGQLQPGEVWRQESIVGSLFNGSFEWCEDGRRISPVISGSAHLMSKAELLVEESDPFPTGIHPNSASN